MHNSNTQKGRIKIPAHIWILHTRAITGLRPSLAAVCYGPHQSETVLHSLVLSQSGCSALGIVWCIG